MDSKHPPMNLSYVVEIFVRLHISLKPFLNLERQSYGIKHQSNPNILRYLIIILPKNMIFDNE